MRGRGQRLALILGIVVSATLIAGAIAWYRSLAVEIEIVPARRIWRRGETITGLCVIRNGMLRVAVVSEMQLNACLGLFDTRGVPAPHTVIDLQEQLAELLHPRSEKLPWAGVTQTEFAIGADPLQEAGGYAMADGEYLLSIPEEGRKWLERLWGAPVRAHPAPIEVRGNGPGGIGTRIFAQGSGGGRLNLVREDGTLESWDVHSGRKLATMLLGADWLDAVSRGNEDREYHFSPDGRWVAKLRASPGPGSLSLIVYRLGEGRIVSREIVIPSVGQRDDPSAFFVWFDCARSRLVLIRNDAFLEVDLTTGAVEVLPELHPREDVEGSGEGDPVTFENVVGRKRSVNDSVWIDDIFEIRDPETGDLLRTLDVSREKESMR